MEKQKKIIIGTAFIVFVLAGAALWDYNEGRYDESAETNLAYDLIRAYHQTGDAGAVACPYVGSSKTHIFHRFTSECSLDISIVHLKRFDSRQEADKSGYSPCPVCKPS